MKFATFRAIITGVIFILFVGLWHSQSTLVKGSTDMQATYPPVSAMMFLFFLLLLLNPLLGKIRPGFRYSIAEIVTVYVMVLVATPLIATGWAQSLLPSRVAFRYYATAENKFEENFFGHVKTWFGPEDSETVRAFFEGGVDKVPWMEWMPTIAVWASFTMILYFTLMCVVILIRKQWIENERLAFPMLKLPMELMQGEKDRKHSLLRNKYLWLGVLIPIIIHVPRGLSVYFAGIPVIPPIWADISAAFTTPPWKSLWGIQIHPKPMFVGIGFLMTLEVSFSLWFFFLFQRFMWVVADYFQWWGGGDSALAGFPFEFEQQHGAFLALAIIYIWMARRHLKASFKAAIEGGKDAWLYRIAWGGFIGGVITIIAFGMMAGMSLLIAAAFFSLLLIHTFIYARINAEAGLQTDSTWVWRQAYEVIPTPFGHKSIGTGNLTGIAFFAWLFQDLRGVMMPRFLDAFKLDDGLKTRLRGFVLIFVIAIVVGMGVGMWSEMNLCYRFGANAVASWHRNDARGWFSALNQWIQNPDKGALMPMVFVMVGASVTGLFSFLRMRYLWWPFHPIGYAMSTQMNPFWSSIFFGWLFRLVLTRLGGPGLYKRALPFFLGLILGDFLMHGMWGIIGSFAEGTGYTPPTW